MAHFLFVFFLKSSETFISLERKQISTNGKKLSFRFSTVVHISQLKKLSKISMHRHFKKNSNMCDCIIWELREILNLTMPPSLSSVINVFKLRPATQKEECLDNHKTSFSSLALQALSPPLSRP